MGDLPLRTPIHRWFGRPLPCQLPNGTHVRPRAINLSHSPHAEKMFHAVLIRLSPGCPAPAGWLHTRYAPVRRSPPGHCCPVLPLDLHVLSLSLAFILSQDQTLRCIILFLPCSDDPFLYSLSINSLTVLIRISVSLYMPLGILRHTALRFFLYYLLICKYFKELVLAIT